MSNLAAPIFRVAQEDPERIAFWVDDLTLSYGVCAVKISRLANALRQWGLRPGDRVGVWLYNTPGFVLTYFAVLSLGAVVIPINTRLTGEELATILRDAEARLLVTATDFFSDFEADCQRLWEEVPSLEALVLDNDSHEPLISAPSLLSRNGMHPLYFLEDWLNTSNTQEDTSSDGFPINLPANTLATLIYTSGTTGKPKGVMLSHRNILADATANVAVIEAVSDDRFVTVSPLFHVFGQTNILVSAMLAGASVALVPKFSPRRILEAITRYRVTFLTAVPTMYLMMLSHLREKDYDLSSLRVCHSGAAPLAVETFHEVEHYFGVSAQEGYGLSEASSIVCSNPLHGVRKPGSVGLPLPGVAVKIMLGEPETTLIEADPDDIGELYVQGDIVMQGYFKQPEQTAKALHVLEPDGVWLRTRDLGYKDADGYIHIVDRADDLINIGGVKIYPREIEEVLHRHPAVHAAAVTGVPSTLHHEAIKAFVVLRPGHTCNRETLQTYCRPHLADFKIPKYYEFVSELPQGATGKILRKDLRERM
jgi:long-chain acyl-CoA synthetase